MSETRRQFEERIARAISRFANHADGEGLDRSELTGRVTLTLRNGELASVEYETPAEPTPVSKTPAKRS